MQKPTSMTVLGILNICFAAMGLFGILVTGLMMFVPGPWNEPTRELIQDSTFTATMLGIFLVGTVTKLLMLGSGVGLLRGQGWGRTMGNVWAPASILYGLTSAVVQAVYILPKQMDAQHAYLQSQPHLSSQQMQMMTAMEDVTFVLAIAWVVVSATVYQVFFMVMINRKSVRDYLAGGGSGYGDGSGGSGGAGDGVSAYGHPSQQQPPAPPEDSPW